jgi:hypothetical protein
MGDRQSQVTLESAAIILYWLPPRLSGLDHNRNGPSYQFRRSCHWDKPPSDASITRLKQSSTSSTLHLPRETAHWSPKDLRKTLLRLSVFFGSVFHAIRYNRLRRCSRPKLSQFYSIPKCSMQDGPQGKEVFCLPMWVDHETIVSCASSKLSASLHFASCGVRVETDRTRGRRQGWFKCMRNHGDVIRIWHAVITAWFVVVSRTAEAARYETWGLHLGTVVSCFKNMLKKDFAYVVFYFVLKTLKSRRPSRASRILRKYNLASYARTSPNIYV